MGLHRTQIHLEGEQVRALERLAAEEQRSVDELVRRAVDGYLAQRRRDGDDWGERFDALVARVRAHMPPDVTPEEIEADIGAAREEVRAERAARRAASDGADAGGR
jgi:hypothetical protein